MPAAGLLGTQNSQSTSGGNLKGQASDAVQGVDADTRRDVQGNTGGGEYAESWDSKEEAEGRLKEGSEQNKGRHF